MMTELGGTRTRLARSEAAATHVCGLGITSACGSGTTSKDSSTRRRALQSSWLPPGLRRVTHLRRTARSLGTESRLRFARRPVCSCEGRGESASQRTTKMLSEYFGESSPEAVVQHTRRSAASGHDI